jgi:hypothetical protein
MKFEISNQTDGDLSVILEPVGDSFEVAPKGVSIIEFANEPSTRIDIYSNNQINVWTEGHVTVTLGDSKMEFTPLT